MLGTLLREPVQVKLLLAAVGCVFAEDEAVNYATVNTPLILHIFNPVA